MATKTKKVTRKWPDIPSLEDLECIISWPKGTAGYQNELEALGDLLRLCTMHGFGRLPQMANQIEDIWRNPEKVAEIKKERSQRFKAIGWE